MADEPALTRWTFPFGRRKVPARDASENGDSVQNGNSSTMNGNGSVRNTAELSIFEQYNQANGGSTHSNGVQSAGVDGKPQKSLLPPFESAEMRTLAESLTRDILRGNPDVKWESIKGLETAKRLLKEAVFMPIKYPK
ncbi:hypothetical protein H5410_007321 [Solanum commersonii]|uniref:Uncharacterized protein n=1 Tax=Solanum commersonii TaxID=4109 RepID=A0A9J6ADS8_SOLCO|nr:hypothetical protein H5410_007321 [Solanum commersonii]